MPLAPRLRVGLRHSRERRLRDLELLRQYLVKERARHLEQAHKIAAASSDQGDYQAIVNEAKAAATIERIIADLKLLDHDSGEFCKRHLL